MSQVNRTEYITNALDEKTPYKITAPRISLAPLRIESESKAISLFNKITEGEVYAILTYNCPVTKRCKILKVGPEKKETLFREE